MACAVEPVERREAGYCLSNSAGERRCYLVPEGGVRAHLVVVLRPGGDHDAGMFQAEE
jgi:hypothetical protein